MTKRSPVQPSRERADDGWYENLPEEAFEQALQALMGLQGLLQYAEVKLTPDGVGGVRYLDNLS